MTHQTKLGLAVMALSLSTCVGGVLLVRHAHTMTPPREPERRALTGTVVEILAEACGYANRRTTCYRPVVSYTDDTADTGATDASAAQPKQIVSRTRYRPSSPHARGERVKVYVEPNGTGWLASEWDERQADRQRKFDDARGFPLMMGWVLLGCGAFGLLLALGLVFWVDRGGDERAA